VSVRLGVCDCVWDAVADALGERVPDELGVWVRVFDLLCV
jgi:hypothetical protein